MVGYKSLILFLSFICIKPQIINISGLPWNNKDDLNFRVAFKRCSIKYPNSPCLKKFVKVRWDMYRAICGK
jgi:hypothetical protein